MPAGVSLTASYEITHFPLSLCPSLSFLKIGSLVFFWHCTWPYLTMISIYWRSQILEKKIEFGANLGQMSPNQAPETKFCPHCLLTGVKIKLLLTVMIQIMVTSGVCLKILSYYTHLTVCLNIVTNQYVNSISYQK